MCCYNKKGSPLIKIVYAKVNNEGKEELVALKLYADGSVERND